VYKIKINLMFDLRKDSILYCNNAFEFKDNPKFSNAGFAEGFEPEKW